MMKHNYSCLGGIVIMHYNLFEKINGFPNNFWGHGGEDTDLQNRAFIVLNNFHYNGTLWIFNSL